MDLHSGEARCLTSNRETRLRQPGEPDTAHLGESETIAIIVNRQLKAAFVTDDRDARRHAAARGIAVYSTWHILKLAVTTGRLTVDEFLEAYRALTGAHRGHPQCARDETSVIAWVTGR